MIDLHTHTNESDGTSTPEELIAEAVSIQLEALAITDHDTLSGYEQALPHARNAGLTLVCGIELSTRMPGDRTPRGRSVHLLGYWLDGAPGEGFVSWLRRWQESRRDRNRRLIARLQSLGLDIKLEEVEALGRNMTARPHFARVLKAKGYVHSMQEAFERYLDESAPGYVTREEPSFADAVRAISESGGISSLAHPVRLGRSADVDGEAALIADMKSVGLHCLEAYHSDHAPEDVERYLRLAYQLELGITGGSDYHGANKAEVRLGTGRGENVAVPASILKLLASLTARA